LQRTGGLFALIDVHVAEQAHARRRRGEGQRNAREHQDSRRART
jgi:hypothetical protein